MQHQLLNCKISLDNTRPRHLQKKKNLHVEFITIRIDFSRHIPPLITINSDILLQRPFSSTKHHKNICKAESNDFKSVETMQMLDSYFCAFE